MYDLKAVFSIQDKGTVTIRRITQEMNKLNQVMKQVSGSSDSFNRAQRQVNSAINNISNTIIRNTSTVNNNTSSVINNITQINRYSSAASRMTSSIQSQSSAVSGLKSQLLGIGAAYLSAQGLASGFGNFTEAADSYSNISARLANVNDGLQTQAQLQDKIFKASQRSRSSYDVMASSVAKLNLLAKDAFSSNNEAIKFTELMTKSFAVSGAGAQEMESGMYQLTQAMAAGKLQGDEFRSIMENAPLLAQAISNTAGVSMGALKEMSSEGTITSDLIKRSLFNAAEEIEEKFGNMPMTFSQAMTLFKSSAKRVFEPLFNQFIGFVNSKTFEKLESQALGFVKKAANGLSQVFSAVKSLYKVWRTIGPVVTKVAKVIGTFVSVVGGIFAIIGAVKLVGAALLFITSPIGLIAAGITGLIFGFKSLYNSSERVRNAIDGIKTKALELYNAFKSGGTSGLIDSLFPPDTAKKVNAIVDGIKSKIAGLTNAFKTDGVSGLFDEIFGAGSFESVKTKFEEVKTYVTEKVTQLSEVFGRLKEAFTQIWSTISSIISNVWTVIEPYLSGLWNLLQILGDVAVLVFNNVIAPAISFIAQLFSTLWTIAQPIINALAVGFELLSKVIKWLWDNVLAPLVEFILTGVKNALDGFSGALATVQGWFETLSGWVSTAYGHVKDFVSMIDKVKMPDWMGKIGSGAMNFVSKMIPGNYHGLSSVPYDNYLTNLHKGEMVLTRQDADTYRSLFNNDGSFSGVSAVDGVSYEQASSGLTQNTYNSTSTTINGGTTNGKSTQNTPSISIAKLADSIVVREDADIDRIADGLVTKILERRGVTA